MCHYTNTSKPKYFRDEYRTHYKVLYKCPVYLLTYATLWYICGTLITNSDSGQVFCIKLHISTLAQFTHRLVIYRHHQQLLPRHKRLFRHVDGQWSGRAGWRKWDGWRLRRQSRMRRRRNSRRRCCSRRRRYSRWQCLLSRKLLIFVWSCKTSQQFVHLAC